MTNTALSTETRPAKPPVMAGGQIEALIPRDMDQAFRLATALASAGDMVPKHYQGNPGAAMAAIVRGMEVGLAPMQALSSIAVINGRATLWGDAMPALMQRAGHHIDVEYEGSGEALVAVATLTRGDSGKQVVRRFGMADAKRAGLLGKQGPWQQYPQRMLAHRARAWAIRDGAADALMGLQVAEESSDYGPDAARDVTPAPKRGGVIYADPGPEVDEIIEAAPAPQPTPYDAAKTAAEKGKAAFVAYWNSDAGKAARAELQPRLADLQAIVAGAEAMRDRIEADPFGDVPPTDTTRAPVATDDEIAEQIAAELAARDAALEG